MNETELKNKAIEWLWRKSKARKTRPCKFSPKEITDEIGGVHTSLGHIKDEVVAELVARGVKIRYIKPGNRRYFEML